MKIRVYPICGHTDYPCVVFADAWEDRSESKRKYIFFVSLYHVPDNDYEFVYDWHPECEIVRVEQLTPAKSNIDKALVHQLEYLLDDKFVKYKSKTK